MCNTLYASCKLSIQPWPASSQCTSEQLRPAATTCSLKCQAACQSKCALIAHNIGTCPKAWFNLQVRIQRMMKKRKSRLPAKHQGPQLLLLLLHTFCLKHCPSLEALLAKGLHQVICCMFASNFTTFIRSAASHACCMRTANMYTYIHVCCPPLRDAQSTLAFQSAISLPTVCDAVLLVSVQMHAEVCADGNSLISLIPGNWQSSPTELMHTCMRNQIGQWLRSFALRWCCSLYLCQHIHIELGCYCRCSCF